MKLLSRRRGDGKMSCMRVAKVLQSFLDGEVDDRTAERVEQHVEMCRRCGMSSDVYREIKASLARCGDVVPETTLRRLRQFGEKLAADGGSAGHDDGGGGDVSG